MHTAANILVALIAIEHVYILVMEMFLWQTPRGRKAFGMSKEQAESTAVLAGNQGLYNGFLAAGLAFSLLVSAPVEAYHLKLFFTACVLTAGVYGGVTAFRKILFLQGLPALIALVVVVLAGAG